MMPIDLSGLQIFNDAIQNNRNLSGGTRIECDKAQERRLGRFSIKQIPANKYVHEANNVARRNFADALTSAFGVSSLNELPKDVRDVLKIEDFKLKDGNVTSSRPLTMRRIRAVMTAIRDVTAKAAPSRQEATAIREHFADYLQRSEYMEAAFDRIAIAEGRKPLTLNIPGVSKKSFDIPLSTLKLYTKGIKTADLASKIDDIKQRIEADVNLATDTLTKLKNGDALPADANRANALRHYFALCAVASDETGRGISRTVSVPDADGKIATYLKASLKGADSFETGVVHMAADPFLEESQAMTRFTVDIGFGESAGYGEAWHVAYNTFEHLAMQEGFSPLMRRGVEPAMSIAQMYANITAESTRLLNAYSAEMDAMFEKHPDLAKIQQEAPDSIDLTKLPEPFNAKIGKILSLRQTLNTFFSKLTLANPAYADHSAIRYADETILTMNKIPAMANEGVIGHAEAGAAAQVQNVAEPYEGLDLDRFLEEIAAEAPTNRKTPEARMAWAVASLISELPAERYADKNLNDFIRVLGSNGMPDNAIPMLRSLDARELHVLHLCMQCNATNIRTMFTMIHGQGPGGALTGPSIYQALMNRELPANISVDFLNAIGTTAQVMSVGTDIPFDECTADNFVQQQWGFNTEDFSAMLKFVKDCGYDPATVTRDDLNKLMSLARLRDFKFDDLPAFYHRVLHKDVKAINTEDLKTLFKLYHTNKLIDPLKSLKPGRTSDAIALFMGDKLPSNTGITGKDMVMMIAKLRAFAKDGGVKEETFVFNEKTVTLSQSAHGLLHITVNGMKVTGAQSAAGFINIFESDMVSHVDRFGTKTILKMLPELSATDIADMPETTSHTREICLRIVADRLEIPASSFATVPTAMLRTIAANALKGYYTTETGAVNKNVANALLSTYTRNDVFTGEEIRDLHAAMVRTSVDDLNRKVVLDKRPAAPRMFNFDPKARLAATQEKARNLLADLIMNSDIISYDEAQRKGEGGQRILNLLKNDLDTFIEVVMNPAETLAGLAEPMRTVLVERFAEMTEALPKADGMKAQLIKGVYKAAFKVMLEVASLPEADRATAVADKIEATQVLKGAILTNVVTKEQLSEAILGMIPQIAGLDEAMDGLVQTAMTQIQETINDKLRANMPEDAGEAEVREESPIWQQSFDRLVGGALTDSSCGYGKFMNEVLSRYFVGATPQEGRQMLASLFRNTDANSTPGQIVGALFKGAGPLLQKMLQALPVDAFGEDMRDALKDMKSNLQPIPEAIVKAHMLDIVNRSNGAIKSIQVVRSLGAASVGQAFLCKMITDEHPNGEECVVKLLRPNVKTIIESERQRFVNAAKATPGMEKTFEGQYARILEELDFTKEKTNINYARNVYEQPVMIYTDGVIKTQQRVVTMNKLHSMEVHPSVPPTMDSLILKKAPGETYDRFMANTREKVREILGNVNASGQAFFKDAGSLRAAEAQLIHLYNDTKTRQDYLLMLTEKWVQEALYGNGFYHGDLHAGNIMTDGDGLTVIDFGNATHLTQEERTHVLKMMAAAMYGRENYFEASFKALISAEGRAEYDNKNTNGELTRELHEILNKGTTTDAGRRIFAALMCLQRHGIEIPGPIYNFAQCQMRLGGAVEEMNTLMNELSLAMNRLSIAPLEGVPTIPEGTESVSAGVRDALAALKRFLNHEEGKTNKQLALELEPHFGSSMVSRTNTFDNTRLPVMIDELKVTFTDRETFDTYILPFVERLTEAKTCNIFGGRNVDMYTNLGEDVRTKLAAFLAARDGDDVALTDTAAKELARAFVKAVRSYQQVFEMHAPDRAESPEDGAFVYAIANVVNSNLQPALKSLGTMAVPIFFDMLSAKDKERATAERMEGSATKVQAYVEAYAGGAIDASVIKTLARISQEFQHPLELPGLDAKASALKSNSNRALFLTTLKFNLTYLENELRNEGIITDETTAEMKTHFVRIAMQFFADRIGGIADSVQKLSNATYANLYDEAFAQEINSPKLRVRDALIHLRFPVEVPQHA
ncbi:MAG: hypothetical protein IKW38_05795 [Kiritimatiellae bacterium]|nr:hypothetical protein [Kiritimatiellia bacterium]